LKILLLRGCAVKLKLALYAPPVLRMEIMLNQKYFRQAASLTDSCIFQDVDSALTENDNGYALSVVKKFLRFNTL
jgi:hypothetical protein